MGMAAAKAPTNCDCRRRTRVCTDIGAQLSYHETAAPSDSRRLAVGSRLNRRNVDLLHLEHRFHDAARLRCVRGLDEFDQAVRDHLPGNPEPVLEPAAGLFAAASREAVPVMVDLALGLAGNLERHRFGELVLRAAIERREWLAVEFESNGQYGAL